MAITLKLTTKEYFAVFAALESQLADEKSRDDAIHLEKVTGAAFEKVLAEEENAWSQLYAGQ